MKEQIFKRYKDNSGRTIYATDFAYLTIYQAQGYLSFEQFDDSADADLKKATRLKKTKDEKVNETKE